MPHIILIGTLDTKLQEFLYLHQQLQTLSSLTSTPLKVTLIDCGRTPTHHEAITISQQSLVTKYSPNPNSPPDLTNLPRGEVIKHMIQLSTACIKDILKQEPVHGILGAGGSGGTSLCSAVMRDGIPFGLPKLIVSTVASGDTAPIVGESDITLMNSVVDIAGTNELLLNVLNNAAGAMVGMSGAYEKFLNEKGQGEGRKRKTRIGITMFGVTTPCVNSITKHLNENYEVEIYIFHATGHGGKAMERLIAEGRLDAVLDLTTTEICDELFGGNMSAGPNRLEAALKAGIPNVISIGATDMVNFGARSSVPEKYHARLLLEHNPTVTLMRTTKEECDAIGRFIVEKIKGFAKDTGMVEVWIPKGGVSVVSIPGEIFEDSEADTALAEAVKSGLKGTDIKVVEDERHVNEKEFAIDIAESLMKIVARERGL